MRNKALRRGLAQCGAPGEQALDPQAARFAASDAEQPARLREHRHDRDRSGMRGHALALRQPAMDTRGLGWALWEPEAGFVYARRAVLDSISGVDFSRLGAAD